MKEDRLSNTCTAPPRPHCSADCCWIVLYRAQPCKMSSPVRPDRSLLGVSAHDRLGGDRWSRHTESMGRRDLTWDALVTVAERLSRLSEDTVKMWAYRRGLFRVTEGLDAGDKWVYGLA